MATYFMAPIPRNSSRAGGRDGGSNGGGVGGGKGGGGPLGGQRLLAHESAATEALTQYRLAAIEALGDYSAMRAKDAIDGHDGYRQALQAGHDRAMEGLSGQAQALLQPHLDRLHNEHLHDGLAHRSQQDQAWSDHASQASLAVDLQEALLWRNDPIQLQRLAERGSGEWLKIAERKGWDERQTGQQIAQWNGRLYGTAIGQHLQDGDVDAARTILLQGRDRIDRGSFDALSEAATATAGRLEAQRHPATAGRLEAPRNTAMAAGEADGATRKAKDRA